MDTDRNREQLEAIAAALAGITGEQWTAAGSELHGPALWITFGNGIRDGKRTAYVRPVGVPHPYTHDNPNAPTA
jgi:hypothetical protein